MLYFFFNDTATTEIYTLSLHDALPISPLFIDLEDCFISHAGISSFYYPKINKNILDEPAKLNSFLIDELNSMHGVIWSRDVLINLGKLQIVGHTRYKEIYFHKKSNALYIDTSAYSGNKLSAVVIEKNDIVDKFSVPTIEEDIESNY